MPLSWARAICLCTGLLFAFPASAQIVSHQKLFEAALGSGEMKEAVALGRKASGQAISEKDFASAARYHLELGTLFFNRGNYLPSIAQGRAGLRVLLHYKVRNDTLRFGCLSLLGAVYARLPMSDSASYWFTESNNWLIKNSAVAASIPEEVCGLYMNMGMFYGWAGDYVRSDKYLQESLRLARETRDRRLEAIIYNYIGNRYFKSREFAKADRYYRMALKGYEAGSADACWGEMILGNNLRNLHQPATGIRHILKGQRVYHNLVKKDPAQYDLDFEIQSANYLAECYYAEGDFIKAEKTFRLCIELHGLSGRHQGEFIAFSWIGLAKINHRRGNLAAAQEFAQKAVKASVYTSGNYVPEDFPAIVSEKTLHQSLLMVATVHEAKWQKGNQITDLEKAVLGYREVLRAAARLRRNMVPEESKHFHVEQVAGTTNTAVELCYELFQKTKAVRWQELLFGLIEENRSMVISDLLHEKFRVIKEVPSLVLVRERGLKQRKIDLHRLLAVNPAQKAADSIGLLLKKLDIESMHFLDSLEREFKTYYALKYDFNELTLAGLQKQLPVGTAYISYFIHHKYVFSIIAGPHGAEVTRLALPRNFKVQVMQLRQALTADPVMFDFSGHRQSAALYDLLIKPLSLPDKKHERLIIARDGLLHYIPFEALEPDTVSGQFLGRNYAISYSYSARLAFPPVRKPESQPRVTGFAPFTGNSIPEKQRLNTSLTEVSTWTGRILTGSSAVKSQLYQSLPHTDILLLATHAIANVAQPENSQIAFYPGKADSVLLATEIINMQLDSLRLVVLSACDGNDGSLNKAEGLLSLARAFRIAGCPSILTTSWKAQSESISKFSGIFHGFLAKGLPADVALLKTRQQFFTDPDLSIWGHPFYWANFSLIGSAASVYPQAGDQQRWYWAVGGSVVLMLVIGMRKSIFSRQFRAPE